MCFMSFTLSLDSHYVMGLVPGKDEDLCTSRETAKGKPAAWASAPTAQALTVHRSLPAHSATLPFGKRSPTSRSRLDPTQCPFLLHLASIAATPCICV